MSQNDTSTTSKMRTRREILRRRRRERQILFFGLLVIAVAATGVWGYLLFTDRATGIPDKPFTTIQGDFNSDIQLACPLPDSYPLEEGTVVVRVQNGTDVQGLAGRTLDNLIGRGFIDGGASNWRGDYDEVARIMFGVEGVQQAYTVARHFEEYEMILDTREGRTVDVVLGVRFDGLVSQRDVILAAEEPLEAPARCLQAQFITAVEPGPATLPDDPTEPEATPSPSASASAEADINDGEIGQD